MSDEPKLPDIIPTKTNLHADLTEAQTAMIAALKAQAAGGKAQAAGGKAQAAGGQLLDKLLIHRVIADAMANAGVISPLAAARIISAIERGEIPCLRINYGGGDEL